MKYYTVGVQVNGMYRRKEDVGYFKDREVVKREVDRLNEKSKKYCILGVTF